MRTFVEYTLWALVGLPPFVILTEALDVAALPAMGVVVLTSGMTSFVTGLIRGLRKAGL